MFLLSDRNTPLIVRRAVYAVAKKPTSSEIVNAVFPWPDGRDHPEKQPPLLCHRDGLGAITQREGEVPHLLFFILCPGPPALLSHLALLTFCQIQSFGVFEGRAKDDLKNAANACGQSGRDFTPPGGETPSQVSQTGIRKAGRNAGREEEFDWSTSTAQWTLGRCCIPL